MKMTRAQAEGEMTGPVDPKELLLYYMLLPDEKALFDSWDHDVDAPPKTELQTAQWRLLRDISQLRLIVENKRRELIELARVAR
jgi:hypothetical protein